MSEDEGEGKREDRQLSAACQDSHNGLYFIDLISSKMNPNMTTSHKTISIELDKNTV